MKKAIALVICALVCALFVGCCTLGIECSSGPTATIAAVTSVGGILQAWVGATVDGMAVADGSTGYTCQPGSPGCVLSVQGQTDSKGFYAFQSNAIPGDWQIGIEADSNCATGAATQIYYLGVSTTSDAQKIVCGNISGGSATASPADCTQVVNNSGGQISTNCPATVTLTLNTPGLPTSQALNVSDYNDAGTQEYSYAGNASSTTTITVPVPKVAGDSVLVIYNPQTEEVIGAALFTLNVTIYNPCGNERSCG